MLRDPARVADAAYLVVHAHLFVGLDFADPEVAVAQYKPELPPEVAITMDSIYVTDEISTQPWYEQSRTNLLTSSQNAKRPELNEPLKHDTPLFFRYAGRIDRAETEARIKSGTRAGNFLIRQKGEDGNTFVHSYA